MADSDDTRIEDSAEVAYASAAEAVTAKAATAKTRKPPMPKTRTASRAAVKTPKAGIAAEPTSPFIAKTEETPMDVTDTIKDAVSKTSAAASEYTDFAKGNVEAFVESGKILAAGLQDLGNKFIAEGKSAFETATADVKALSAIKSPTELLKFQTDLLRRNIDSAVAYGSKTGEAMVKLTNEVFAPISGRVSLVVEKAKAA